MTYLTIWKGHFLLGRVQQQRRFDFVSKKCLINSRHFNVGSTLWTNVEITLNRRWKWNKIRRRIFNVAQCWYNVSARSWNNVETTLNNVETTLHNVGLTLIQCCYNLASTLVKAILNPVGLVMIMDLQIHE